MLTPGCDGVVVPEIQNVFAAAEDLWQVPDGGRCSHFARIRSYIETGREHGLNPVDLFIDVCRTSPGRLGDLPEQLPLS